MKRLTPLLLLLPLLLCLLPASAEVTQQHAIRWYDAKAEPGQALLLALNQATPVRVGGKAFHGYTVWDVRWQFRWQGQADGSCVLTSVNTTLTSTITLPRLITASAVVRAEFDRYLSALTRHEEGHKQIGVNAAHEVDATLARLPPMAGCAALEREANRQGEAIIARANRLNQDYDAATQHGCTQGACLRP